ncbi:ABC transporter permease [Alloacidobacterium dinghuense]|uniref:ABC transporter permease n=1 Tax=Alloacidobacterium dinghuense TaxID=2763107 RepID=A0A7G8BG43_9BACT|nr:ABC transporter permease [Alloacidobacterium dinghuense]QNI31513.1 ABC transporter permease [Alloacidobacterium dinghuense]
MLTDLRFALRQLRQSPGFTLTAVLTLALGIGATTAIFTLVHQVLLKSLPVTKPEELYRIGDKVHCCMWGGFTQWEEFSLFNYELYKHFRDHTPAFADLAAMQEGASSMGVRRAGTQQPAEAGMGQFVSGNYFRTFGIGAWAGRVLTDSDDREGAPPVAMMTYHAWQTKYGSDPSVIGATFEINSKPFTVVGIAPPGFFGAELNTYGVPDFWMPLSKEPYLKGISSLLKEPNLNWLDIIGRVRQGTDPKGLEAQLRLELREWQMSHLADMNPQEKEFLPKQVLHLTAGGAGVTAMRQQYHDSLVLLMIAAGCVLLIACANLANLLLARGMANRQQTSVRLALGASRMRMVRKALVESMLLGILGGATGLVIAYAGTSMMLRLVVTNTAVHVPIEASPSLPVLLFALGVSLVTGVCFGVAPAWVSSHAEPLDAMRGANRSVAGATSLPQKALVVTQAALSVVLVSAAAMLTHSLRNMKDGNFGFETKDRYIAWIDPMEAGYQENELENLFERMKDRLQRIPGVRSVGLVQWAPMSGDNWNASIRIEGKAEPHKSDNYVANSVRMMPGFFDTIGNRIIMGRPITEEDTASSRHVAVINEAFAKKFFKGENPLGQHFGEMEMKHAGDYEVVGVAADARYVPWDMLNPIEPLFFKPEAQTIRWDTSAAINGEMRSHSLGNIVLWAPGNPPGLETQVRRALAEINPNLSINDLKSYDEALSVDFAQQGLIAKLTSLFGGLALVLAAVGLYGVTAYGVEQRTNEIGIRMALGADRLSVVKMVMRGAFLQVGIGLAIGIPAAIGAGHAMASQLFYVKPWNPLILISATLLLGLAALIAAVVPSQRAASVEPMEALRNE